MGDCVGHVVGASRGSCRIINFSKTYGCKQMGSVLWKFLSPTLTVGLSSGPLPSFLIKITSFYLVLQFLMTCQYGIWHESCVV